MVGHGRLGWKKYYSSFGGVVQLAAMTANTLVSAVFLEDRFHFCEVRRHLIASSPPTPAHEIGNISVRVGLYIVDKSDQGNRMTMHISRFGHCQDVKWPKLSSIPLRLPCLLKPIPLRFQPTNLQLELLDPRLFCGHLRLRVHRFDDRNACWRSNCTLQARVGSMKVK